MNEISVEKLISCIKNVGFRQESLMVYALCNLLGLASFETRDTPIIPVVPKRIADLPSITAEDLENAGIDSQVIYTYRNALMLIESYARN